MNTITKNGNRDYKALGKCLRDGETVTVDPHQLAHANPGMELLPEERVMFILARCYQGKEDWVVSWANQVRAAEFVNKNGLAAALDECLRLDPNSLDEVE